MFAFINNRKQPKGTEQKMLEHWEAANALAKLKLKALERIADALESRAP